MQNNRLKLAFFNLFVENTIQFFNNKELARYILFTYKN